MMEDFGKLPPQARDMEKAVLCAVLLESEAIWKVINLLHDECFYVDAHQKIWRAIVDLYRANEPIDILTVNERLKKNGTIEEAGGYYYLMELTNTTASAANIEAHSMVVKECYLRRRLITISTNVIVKMYDDTADFFDGMDCMLNEVEAINSEINRIQQVSFSDAVYETIGELKEAGESKTYRTGIQTQLSALDKQTMGFQPTDLVIVAARPAMGKTALVVDFMRYQGSQGIPAGFFSLEMSIKQIIARMYSSETEIDLKQIRKGGMSGADWSKMDASTFRMAEYPIYICDKGGLSINDVVSIAKGWKIKYNIQILYIDYLQLLSGTFKKNGNREQEISEISRRLKQLAKELGIPVIALSQLSRACEARSDKRPMLSDLRESGSIEQDADMVIFPFREEYYNESAEKGVCELIIAKYRNGETGKVYCLFNIDTQKFSNQDNPF